MRSHCKQNEDYWVFSGQFSSNIIHIFAEICYGHQWSTKCSTTHWKAPGYKNRSDKRSTRTFPFTFFSAPSPPLLSLTRVLSISSCSSQHYLAVVCFILSPHRQFHIPPFLLTLLQFCSPVLCRALSAKHQVYNL